MGIGGAEGREERSRLSSERGVRNRGERRRGVEAVGLGLGLLQRLLYLSSPFFAADN